MKAIAAWLVLLAAMIANGVLRAAVLAPGLGEHRARQVSSLLAVCIVVSLAGIFVRRLPDPRPAALLRIGLLWGALTVAFELGFGRVVSGLSLEEMAADYDLAAGRLWPLVLAATVLAPAWWGLAIRGAAPRGHGGPSLPLRG